MDEQQFVVQMFQKAFEQHQNEKIVLYGLGKNTEAILKKTTGYNFVGLMDSKNVGEIYWGYEVLNERAVLKLKPIIVIIARESIVPIIYERIAYLHDEHNIMIYNFKGDVLGWKEWEYLNQSLPYWSQTEEELKKEIDRHDCISFDIFDTLLMRKVLEPEDVFDIIENFLDSENHETSEFKRKRIQAEKNLSGCPSIHQIYEEMGRIYHVPDEKLAYWKKAEYEIEGKLLVPRKKVREIFNYCIKKRKIIYLLSDMYFSKSDIEIFLSKAQISGYRDCIISCDYGKSKEEGGLYDIYKKMSKAGSYLHIGDNRRVDGERANEKGIDSFLIYSAYEMWQASSMQMTLSSLQTLKQRCILGNIVWKYCENPFALQKKRGVVTIESGKELGYLFLGALYTEFIHWLIAALTEKEIKYLLLPARDGFLISKMLEQERNVPCEYKYFKASRRAVSVAAMQSREDILLLAQRGFAGTYGELLEHRFGVKAKKDDLEQKRTVSVEEKDRIIEYILSYEQEILDNAGIERKQYVGYLQNMKLVNHDRKALFDFVAGGSVQYYLSKLLEDKDLEGLYFATMNHPNPLYGLDYKIKSAYGNIMSYGSENQVGKYYLLLEAIMVDEFPTLIKVGENNNFVYEENNYSDFAVIQDIQEGILEYQKDMLIIEEWIGNLKAELDFADKIFGKVFEQSCSIDNKITDGLYNDDLFDGVKNYKLKV